MADVTVRRQNELELLDERGRLLERERAQNERLRSLDRLKDEFVALVSHELRTPLTSIRGYLELVLDDADQLATEHQEFLQIVDRNVDRLLHLVSDLLLVAQVDAGKLTFEWTEVDLVSLVGECVQAAGPAAEVAGVELVFDATSARPIIGDPSRLGQLLDNLISNAIKFTPAGGRVDVAVDASGDGAVIEVRDTGYGIAARGSGPALRALLSHAIGERHGDRRYRSRPVDRQGDRRCARRSDQCRERQRDWHDLPRRAAARADARRRTRRVAISA